MNYPHINVEETFDQLVRDYGTSVVLRDILPKNKDTKWPNADYIFHSEKIVVELKCLMDDNSKDKGKQLKLNAVVDKYYSDGKIASKIISEDTWKGLPSHLQSDISKIYSPSIRARIKEANAQIRETKKALGLDSYSGMLIIANDGLITMPPAAFVDAAVRYITNNLHNIDLFIFITANLFSTFEGSSSPVVFWFPMSMEKPSKISYSFINHLRLTWQSMVEKRMGITHSFSQQIKDEDMGKFWNARHFEK